MAGYASIAGGLGVIGGTTTDTLAVGAPFVTGGPNLQVTGGSFINGGSTFTNYAAGYTSINGGVLTVNGATSGQSITLDANADVLTVTNGTAAGTTTINNGVVTAGTSLNAPTVNADTVNAGTVNTANANIGNSLNVAPGATVNMGGNRVQDVGTPIFASDAANKAYVDRGVNRAFEGAALALAIEQPIFLPGQTFAIRAGWGDFEGQNAVGFSAAGVIAHNVLGYGSTLTVDAGVGVGTDYSQVGGKAGVTLGFGGGIAPIK